MGDINVDIIILDSKTKAVKEILASHNIEESWTTLLQE